jgi:hypothetical protein
MDEFDLDNPYHRNRQPKRKIPILLIGCIVSTATIIFAYANDLLPHYTATIDGMTITLARDDPRYLAEQAALEAEASRQIYRINGTEVSEFEYRQALANQQNQQPMQEQMTTLDVDQRAQPSQQAQNEYSDVHNGQTRKCIDAQGKVIYQTETCFSKGYKTQKLIQANDGAVSTATYSYKQEPQPQVQTTTAQNQVATMGGTKSSGTQSGSDSECKYLEARRESIRSLQRYNSTQSLRDEYADVSKQWQKRCLGTQNMS